jgi:membrane complex biogenesis BtpA family protein
MFGRTCSIIGAVHVPALPGSANFSGNMEQLLGDTIFDALTYKECGVDALIVENMHDAPYFKGFVEPEAVAAMTVLANAVKYETMLPIGIQLLAGANIESLAVALACGLDFIRVEGFVYAHVGDEGIHESCAAELIRRRAYLKAERVKIFADIKKKHSAHAITDDVSLVETAEAARFFQADGVIVSGRSTGHPPDFESLKAVKEGVDIPVLVGSGANSQNAQKFAEVSDAIIVGSDLKIDGRWQNAVDPERVERFMAAVKVAR